MHSKLTSSVAAALLLAGSSHALSVPSNVANLYKSIKAQGTCKNKLATGFWSQQNDAGTYSYCGDHQKDYNVIYIQGENGNFANMDIDCDGDKKGPGNDGRCGNDPSGQDITSFQWLVEGYNKGVKDLNPYVHSYVVFGNTGSKYTEFDPEKYGIQPLSVMAVVCGDKMFYGVWGDENGDDGPHPMVGEASLSLATACYGSSMNGNNGHGPHDVLYLAFPGSDAVPGAGGAAWNAKSFDEFHKSLESRGNNLIKRIGGGGGTTPTNPGPTPTPTSSPNPTCGNNCSWPGHCQGCKCSTWDDCSDDLICTGGVCSKP